MSAMFYPEGTERPLDTLVALSREFGANDAYVLAGGGNTSVKDADTMYVKASGTRLGTIDAEGFVPLSLTVLNRIWDKTYPADTNAREDAVLSDMNDARAVPGDARRPSVESLLHGFFPYPFVVHTHPALVNGLTCSKSGEAIVSELFGDTAIWIPVIDPGYTLAKHVREAALANMAKTGIFPRIAFLQNHGVFVAGSNPAEIRGLYGMIMNSLGAKVRETPAGLADSSEPELALVARVAADALPGAVCETFTGEDIKRMTADSALWSDLEYAITPDHIVYFGYRTLLVRDAAEAREAIPAFAKREGFPPRIVAVQGKGAVAVNTSPAKASEARSLFGDQVKVAVYARSFGGMKAMPEANVNFIRTWEAEKYRASKSG